ncbi:hypothetical protein [Breznakia pachnodae]|uniref:Uncharacterized protein n=1 Tax=Breznakia pachnodae TaxID=265178 RepID=A0ABU0E743_9FIRM|nr:hypothetical protein [Breznakia pachnodae]MDQ0362528.1 hypothetical protein [Breznakia pachnodae]
MLTKFNIAGVVQSFHVDDNQEHGVLRIQTDENETDIVDVHVYDSKKGLLELKNNFKKATIAKCEGFMETLGLAKAVPLSKNPLQQTELLVYQLVAKSMEFLTVDENENDSTGKFKA